MIKIVGVNDPSWAPERHCRRSPREVLKGDANADLWPHYREGAAAVARRRSSRRCNVTCGLHVRSGGTGGSRSLQKHAENPTDWCSHPQIYGGAGLCQRTSRRRRQGLSNSEPWAKTSTWSPKMSTRRCSSSMRTGSWSRTHLPLFAAAHPESNCGSHGQTDHPSDLQSFASRSHRRGWDPGRPAHHRRTRGDQEDYLARANDPRRPVPPLLSRHQYVLNVGSPQLELILSWQRTRARQHLHLCAGQKTLMVVDVIFPAG